MDKDDRGKYDPMAEPETDLAHDPDLTEEQEEAYMNNLAGSKNDDVPKPPLKPAEAEQADYAAASEDVRALDRGVGPDYHKKGKKRLLSPVVLASVLVALILAMGVYYWLAVRAKPAPKTATKISATTQTTPATQPKADTKISSTTKSYTSPNFNLSIKYPNDWTVADNGGSKMTITSPTISLKGVDGQTKSLLIVLTISQKGQNLTAFDKGNATAVIDSEKVAYTAPTSSQRANTYLSFLQYASTTASGALDGIYITGDYGYQKAQDVLKNDIANIDPLISVSFSDATGKQTSIAATDWADTNLSAPLKAMLQSLAIN